MLVRFSTAEVLISWEMLWSVTVSMLRPCADLLFCWPMPKSLSPSAPIVEFLFEDTCPILQCLHYTYATHTFWCLLKVGAFYSFPDMSYTYTLNWWCINFINFIRELAECLKNKRKYTGWTTENVDTESVSKMLIRQIADKYWQRLLKWQVLENCR